MTRVAILRYPGTWSERDFLVSSGWNKEPPGPALPPEVVEGTSQRYRECYGKLTGEEWFG